MLVLQVTVIAAALLATAVWAQVQCPPSFTMNNGATFDSALLQGTLVDQRMLVNLLPSGGPYDVTLNLCSQQPACVGEYFISESYSGNETCAPGQFSTLVQFENYGDAIEFTYSDDSGSLYASVYVQCGGTSPLSTWSNTFYYRQTNVTTHVFKAIQSSLLCEAVPSSFKRNVRIDTPQHA